MSGGFPGYELVDFGDGRKLERIGSLLLDRPSIAAESSKSSPSVQKDWNAADLFYDGRWRAASKQGRNALEEGWNATLKSEVGEIDWDLKPTPAGHIGLFPEHLHSFDFVLRRRKQSIEADVRPKALNLFAYTGFGSIQCALGGFAVTHVDSSRPSVQWAKQNLELNSGQNEFLVNCVRYLVDDAMAFAKREQRRSNRYDLICLDPPAYGHGPQGKAWRIDRDLPILLEVLFELLSERPLGIMLCGHSDADMIQEIAASPRITSYARHLSTHFGYVNLRSTTGKNLNFGYRQLWMCADD